MHLQGEAQDRMNALMERTQELGMHFTHSVVDPAALGTLQLTGGLAGGCCRAVGERGRSGTMLVACLIERQCL